MANMLDYLVWRGEFGFDQSPWNEVDAAMMATLCYMDFADTDNERGRTLAEAKRLDLSRETGVANMEDRKAQFEAMAESRRFCGIRMHHFISLNDPEQELQFSAVCYDLPDGTLCIAFRGTDGTFVGWKEDFNMSFRNPVPAQEAALIYLEKAAEMDGRPIRLTGHSKGGNLAAYAAACCGPEVQDRLVEVDTFDGPGMHPDVFGSEGYRRVLPKIRSFVPQTSIVGMMMEYHRNYTVVRSGASGIGQHEPLTWQVYGPRFETLDRIDDNARMISETLHGLLNHTDREERAVMVDTLFDLLESTKASTVSEMKSGRLRSLASIAVGSRDMDPESRRAMIRLVGLLLSLGFGSLTERYRTKQQEKKPEIPEDPAGSGSR